MISLLLGSSCAYAETTPNVIDNTQGKFGIALVNEEIRKLSEDITNNNTALGDQITIVANSGFGIVLSGEAETGTNIIPSRYYLPVGGTITKIIAYAKTAPTGSDLIIDVNINGSTILDSSKVTIPASSNSVTVTSFASDSFAADDYLTIDIDQVGSSNAGEDILLSFYVQKDT